MGNERGVGNAFFASRCAFGDIQIYQLTDSETESGAYQLLIDNIMLLENVDEEKTMEEKQEEKRLEEE